MARMVPSSLSEATKSDAERHYFRRLRDELDDDWSVLHSVGIADHPRKPWAEIDFLLIGPLGVFGLEVKGGGVRREKGLWVFTDRNGNEFTKKEGPWEQVGTAMAALQHHLRDTPQSDSLARRSLFGSGVVLPDVLFRKGVKAPSADVDLETLYDADDAKADLKGHRSFESYVRRLSVYWGGRFGGRRGLDASDRVALVKALRGDFELVPPLGVVARNVDDALLTLTEEQYEVMDSLVDNDRVLIRGGAGTGKTLLGAYEAERLRETYGDAARILFTCFNRNLATFLADDLSARAPGVRVSHFHAVMDDAIASAGLTGELATARETADAEGEEARGRFYEREMPELALRALKQTGPVVDVAIIDEGQDLLSGPFAEVLDALLEGGIHDGTWRLFLDPRQDVFGHLDAQALGAFRGARPAELRLLVNCRNTYPIAEATALLSGIAPDVEVALDGPAVVLEWFATHEQQGRLAAAHVDRLLRDGVRAHRIAILSRYRRENSYGMQNFGKTSAPIVDIGAEGWRKGAVMFATVTGFKGLEADAVILLDNSYVLSEQGEHVDPEGYYVGLSRAKSVLIVMLHERNRGSVHELKGRRSAREEIVRSPEEPES